jgi:hypothetical protein
MHALFGIAKLRVVPAAIAGPPNAPATLRVSTARQGMVAGTYRRPPLAVAWVVTVTLADFDVPL